MRIAWRPLPYVDPRAQRGPLRRALVRAASSRLVGRLSRTALWRQTVWRIEAALQRASGGRLTTGPGLSVALLETRGARTGQPRNGVIYFHDADRVIIVASQAGYPTNPAWFYNARAHPDVRLGGQPFRAQVRTRCDGFEATLSVCLMACERDRPVPPPRRQPAC